VRPIADYALLGDCHSAALVARDGSIDWACFPRFDSPALFCRILDVERGGTFGVSAEGTLSAERAYLEESNVLATRFETPTGRLELTDCMPVEPFDPQRPARVATRHALLRRVRCLEGEVTAQVVIAPRFEYGALVPRFRAVSAGSAEIVGGADAVSVRATRRLEVADTRVRARWRLHAGEEAWLEARWSRAGDPRDLSEGEPREFQLRLQDTLAFWRDWMRACKTVGEPQWLVRRSALVLKALTYAPTGAVVAAPTTSLPERIGGARNWDYRYTWIRDATLTLTSLTVLGFLAEAGASSSAPVRAGPRTCRSCTASRGAGRFPSSISRISPVTGARRRCESGTPQPASASSTRTGSSWRQRGSTRGSAGSSRPATGGCSRATPTSSASAGAIPTTASGRYETSPATSCTRSCTAGWPSIGPSGWPRRGESRDRSRAGGASAMP
jgi:hypothetical protein